MKLCAKCGAYNADERMFCVDCSEKLGDPLSDSAEQQLRAHVSGHIDRLYNRKDPLYVSVFDKVMGIAALAGAVCSLVIMVIGWCNRLPFEYLWVSLLFFLLTGVEALVPRLTWELEKFRLTFLLRDADDVQPSSFYLITRKITIVLTLVIGLLTLLDSLAENMLN